MEIKIKNDFANLCEIVEKNKKNLDYDNIYKIVNGYCKNNIKKLKMLKMEYKICNVFNDITLIVPTYSLLISVLTLAYSLVTEKCKNIYGIILFIVTLIMLILLKTFIIINKHIIKNREYVNGIVEDIYDKHYMKQKNKR